MSARKTYDKDIVERVCKALIAGERPKVIEAREGVSFSHISVIKNRHLVTTLSWKKEDEPDLFSPTMAQKEFYLIAGG